MLVVVLVKIFVSEGSSLCPNGLAHAQAKAASLRLRTDETKQCYPDPQWPFTHPENCWKNFGIPPPGEKFGIDLLP